MDDTLEDKMALKPVVSYTLLPHCPKFNAKYNAYCSKSSNKDACEHKIVNKCISKEEYEKKHQYVFSDKAKVELNCLRALINTIDIDHFNINTATEYIKGNNDKRELQYGNNYKYVSEVKEIKIKDPSTKTYVNGRYDRIMKRIREAYEVCSCKICNCLGISTPEANKVDVCNCKPCNCTECQKYKLNFKRATYTKPGDLKTYEMANSVNTAEPYECKPCQCEAYKCKLCKHVTSVKSVESDELLTKMCKIETMTKFNTTRDIASTETRKAKFESCKSCIYETCNPEESMLNTPPKQVTVSTKFSSILKMNEEKNYENQRQISNNVEKVEDYAQSYQECKPVRHNLLSTCIPFGTAKFIETRNCKTQTCHNKKSCQHNKIPFCMKCEKCIVTSDGYNTVFDDSASEMVPQRNTHFTVLPLIGIHQSCAESIKHYSKTNCNTHLNKNIRTKIDPVTVSKPAIDKTIFYKKTISNHQNNVSANSSCSECSDMSRKRHRSIESCNSSGHDRSDYLIRFPRDTVENCTNDVMKDFGKNVTLTQPHVKITSKKDNCQYKAFVQCKNKLKAGKPLKHTSVIQEKLIDSDHESKKPNRGKIVQAKLCKYWKSQNRCDCQPCDCDGCPHEKEKYSRCRCDCVTCSCYGTCLSEDKSIFIRKNQSLQTETDALHSLQNFKTYRKIGIETESTPRVSNARSKNETLPNNSTFYKTLKEAKAFSSELMKILESMIKVANLASYGKPEVNSVAIQNTETISNKNNTFFDNGVQNFASEELVTKDIDRYLNKHNIKEANINNSIESLYNSRHRKSELVPFPSSQFTTNYKMNGALKLDINTVTVDKYLVKHEIPNLHIPLINAIKDKSSEEKIIKHGNLWYDKAVKENSTKKYCNKVVTKNDYSSENNLRHNEKNAISINPSDIKNTRIIKTRQQHNMPEYSVSKQLCMNLEHENLKVGSTTERRAKFLSKWIETIEELGNICGEYNQHHSKMAEKYNAVEDSDDDTLINTALRSEVHNMNSRTLVDKLTFTNVNKDFLDKNIVKSDDATETSKKNETNTAKRMVDDNMNNLTQLFNNEMEVLLNRPQKITKINSQEKRIAMEDHKSEAATSGCRKINFNGLKRISDHAILAQWDPPKDLKDVQGYEKQTAIFNSILQSPTE